MNAAADSKSIEVSKLHRILHRLPASGDYCTLLPVPRRVNGSG
jgi:hypothetical protein